MSLPAADNFTRANAATLGANWDGITLQELGITSNSCHWQTGGSASEKFSLWSADSFNADHYSECIASTLAGAYGHGPCVRVVYITSHSQTQCYWALIDSATTVTIYYMNAGAFNAVGAQFTGLTVANGDLWRLSVTGTTLTLSQNGVSKGTRTDSTLSAGSAGLGIYADRGALNNWVGGNVGAAAAFGPEMLQPLSQPTREHYPTIVM